MVCKVESIYFYAILAEQDSLATRGMSRTSEAVPGELTELEAAMQKHMEFVNRTEYRPFCYLDFLHFEVGGKEYTMTHGTFRNKILKLKEKAIVELAYSYGIAFYALKGTRLGNKAAALMTPNHIGIQPLLQHIRRVPSIRKHPLYKLIRHHPFNKAAVHDVHLKFVVASLWSILSKNTDDSSTGTNEIHIKNVNENKNSRSLSISETDPYSKDIRLERRVINDLDIQVTVHHTDTVTVVIGCSFAPIITDEPGVIRLSDALAIIEEELSQLTDQCDNSNHVDNIVGNTSYSKVDVPNHMSWIVTRWDFGIDGLITYTGPQFFFSWGSSQIGLIGIYIKEWAEEDHRIRVEIQEFPDKSLGRALREKLNPRKGS